MERGTAIMVKMNSDPIQFDFEPICHVLCFARSSPTIGHNKASGGSESICQRYVLHQVSSRVFTVDCDDSLACFKRSSVRYFSC